MFTVKCPLHFLLTSGGNIMTHAYWWKCNTVIWKKKYQLDITALSAILWNSWVASNCQVVNNYKYTVPASVWLQAERQGFNKVCVSVVNNKVCVVVMLIYRLCTLFFSYIARLWRSQAWTKLNFGTNSSIKSALLDDSAETVLCNVEYITNKLEFNGHL
jgi:hypothetical protein